MKKLTQAQFDERLKKRVNLVARSLDKLAELVEHRPDLLDDDRNGKVQVFLGGRIESATKRMDDARTVVNRAQSEGFKL